MKPADPDLFDLAAAKAARDAAMEQVDENADDDWKEVAFSVVIEVARVKAEFTVDDVQEQLANLAVSTHEGRAMGPVILRAVREKIIVSTGIHRPSRQVKCHANPTTLWRSLIAAP